MIGKTLGNYEIVEPLGAGGMGEVYRAHDTNLKRDVAIKVLPEALSVDTERLARLQREAQLLASVNHPNIATIHNLEEADGVRWLVLELVEGETLEQMLRRGALSADDSLRIGAQVASALEAAHDKGIVHRDLKSANVMVDGKGRVKVLDFGIAKDMSGADAEGPDLLDTSLATQVDQAAMHLTATGVIVGTAPYMSPEQIRGRNIDKRTDIWAFGCLMYELLAGRRPFDRETMADTLSAILEHEPDWERLPADTLPALRSLIERCLQKNADNRLHDIADARVELEHIETTGVGLHTGVPPTASAASSRGWSWSGLQVAAASVVALLVVLAAGWGLSSRFSAARSDVAEEVATDARQGSGAAMLVADAPAPNSIAVMPLDNVGGDDDEHSAENLWREVQTRLESVSGMFVISRRSSVFFKDSDELPAAIGSQLNAAHLLYGTLAKDGATIDVELMDAAGGEVLWSDRYLTATLDLDSYYAVLQSIALQVAEELEVEVSGREEDQLGARPTENLEAMRAYLAGKRVQELRTPDSLEQSLRDFRRALALDPEFALAYVGVAETFRFLARFASMPGNVARLQAQQNVAEALKFDPELGAAFRVLADLQVREGGEGWRATMDKAIALNPNDPRTHEAYAWQLGLRGEWERASELARKARELDPLGPTSNETLGSYAFVRGDFDEAITQMRLAVAVEPEAATPYMGLGYSLHYGGHADEAVEELRESQRLNPVFPTIGYNLSGALASLGQAAEALTIWDELINESPDNPIRWRAWLEAGYIHRDVVGSLDQAETYFQQALDAKPPRRKRWAELRVALALLDLDRGDDEAAERHLAEAEEADPEQLWTGIGRLNLEMYRRSYAEGVPLARTLAEVLVSRRGLPNTYNDQWAFPAAVQQPFEPLGYFSVLAGRPEDSLLYFEVHFPKLLEADEPPVHAFTLGAAIDLAVVLRASGDPDRATLLLDRSEAYINGLPEAQRRHQFRTAAMEIYALQGRVDLALDAMQQAIDDGFLSGWWRLDKKPHFALLRDEPRFQEMVRQLRDKAAG